MEEGLKSRASSAGRKRRSPSPPPNPPPRDAHPPNAHPPNAHLPSFLLPESKMRWRPGRLSSYQRRDSARRDSAAAPAGRRRQSRRRPQRPKSAANVRDFQRRRRQREMRPPSTLGDGGAGLNTQTATTVASGTGLRSRSSYAAAKSDNHRKIIELSVGIEQLLHRAEGHEEEWVAATLSACLAALSTNLIIKKQSDALSLAATAEVAKLLVKHQYRVEKPEMGTDPFLFYII